MAMNVGPGSRGGEPEPMMEINTTPLIDVMLVLLVMLIITIPIQLHAVDLNMPHGQSQKNVEPRIVRIDILPDGMMLWNSEIVPDRANLEERMHAAQAEADQPEIHIKPSKDVTYDRVAMVLASAQRIGLHKLGVVGGEEFR